MLGLMQEWPLLCHKILDYAARQHGGREIVSRSVEGPIVRTNYRDLRARALKVAPGGVQSPVRALTMAPPGSRT